MHAFIRQVTMATGLALALSACQPPTTVETGKGSVSAGGLRDHLTINSDGLPPARIGRDGTLRIGGEEIALNPAQQQRVRDYYTQLDGISQAGIEVGKQGAALAGKAASEALKGVLSGNTDAIGDKIEAETGKIEAAALQICDHLAGLRSAQDAMGMQVPQFQAYATLSASDIDECRDKGSRTGMTDAERARKQTEIRDGIRQAIRGGVQTATAPPQSDAAVAADAAAGQAAAEEVNAAR